MDIMNKEVTLTISNPLLLNKLEEYSEEEGKEYLLNSMDIGSILIDNSTEIVADSKLMGPLKELILKTENKINDNIDDKLGPLIGKNSSMLGKFAENMYEKIVKKSFPKFTIINTATSGDKCGDIVIETHTTMGKISIESKNYETAVPKDQIDKFKRDLRNSGIQYGIMISTNSQITGKGDFEIEYYEDKIIIYIQNAGYEPAHLNLAIRYLLTFHEIEFLKHNPMTKPNTNKEYLDKLDKIAVSLHKQIRLERSLITDVEEGQAKIEHIMLKVKSSLYKMIAEKEVLLDQTNQELNDIKIEYGLGELRISTFDDVNYYINEECQNKTKPKKILLTRAFTLIHQANLQFSLDEGIVSFYKDSQYNGKIDCKKGKQEIMIKEYGIEIQPYNKNMVVYKNDHYIFEIKDLKEVWSYLEGKLKM